MSMPASTSDACTAHATKPTGVAGSRSSSKDLSAGGMGVGRRVATNGAPRPDRPAASAGEVGASRDAVDAAGVLTAAATSPRCSAACRHRRLRSSSSVCAGALVDATGASAGAFVVAAAARRPVSDEDVHEVSAGDAARPERRALSRALRRHVVGPVERHRDVLGGHRPVEALGRHRGSELREGAHLGDLDAHRVAGSGDTHAKLDAHLARRPVPSARALDCASEATTTH